MVDASLDGWLTTGRFNAMFEERMAKFEEFNQYLAYHVNDHMENPREDLISFLLNAEIMGNKLSPEHVRGTIILLIVAGIDTTWSGIGNSLWHLATNPVDRRRLAENPSMIPAAVEEFLRAYAPVTMARLVKKDYEFHGGAVLFCKMLLTSCSL